MTNKPSSLFIGILMELLKKHLPVNMGTDLDLRMEMNDIKHSSVRVKIDLKSTAGYKRSKIASQLKSLTKSTKNVEKKTIVFTRVTEKPL